MIKNLKFNMLHLYQVAYFFYHTQYLRRGFMLDRLVHLLQTQCSHRILLTLRTIYCASYLCDFYLCHLFGFVRFIKN